MLSAAGVPLQAIELGESVSKFVLWELMAIYGCREYDPESFSPYELRNGVNEERDEELSLLVFAHWQEDANDKGLSAVRWVKLEDIMRQLRDCELSVLDHYLQNHQSEKWERERRELRERFPFDDDDERPRGWGRHTSRGVWWILARSGSFWLVLARSGSFWLSFCRVLLFLHAACRPSPGRAAEIGLDMSGYVWICLDVSGCPDIRLSGCLDIHVDLSGFVWICLDMCV